MAPHKEGGWYRPAWKSGVSVPARLLPPGYPGERKLASLIYYLLQGDEVSKWHMVRGDELWFWHRGGALEISLSGDGGRTLSGHALLGDVLEEGARPVACVPGGVWQSARLVSGDYTLVSCLVAPGYEEEDFFFAPP